MRVTIDASVQCSERMRVENTRDHRSVRQMVPRGLEPRTLRLLAVRSNQLSYETSDQSAMRMQISASQLAAISVRIKQLQRNVNPP